MKPFDMPLEKPDYETLFHAVIRENTLLELEITKVRASERARIFKELHDLADSALTEEFWKPLDVSMQDAREIAQDAIREVAWAINPRSSHIHEPHMVKREINAVGSDGYAWSSVCKTCGEEVPASRDNPYVGGE